MNTQDIPTYQVYAMVELSTMLGLLAGYFLTREQGERAYEMLRTKLTTLPNQAALVLDFPLHQIMDVSFADESVIRLAEEIVEGHYGERSILLQGLSDDTAKNLNAVIELRRLKLALLRVEAHGHWECVGHIEPTLRETLALVAKHRYLTAPELAVQCDLAINTASTRLKRLYDLHLITRTYEISKKGLEYTYQMWKWTS